MLALRDYQSDAIRRVTDALRDGRKPVLVSPTGSGKTVIAAAMLTASYQAGRRALFLAPRRELVKQTVEKCVRSGLPTGVIMSGSDARTYAPVQVASIPTLHSRLKRQPNFQPDADLIIVDECHLSVSPSTLSVLARYPNAHIIGLTATPARADGRALGLVYDALVPVASVRELTERGFLCPATYYAPSEPDLSEVRVDSKTRDYVQAQVEEIMDRPKLVGDVVEHWFKLAQGRRTVVFASSIKHSEHLAHEFRSHGITAEHVDAMTPEAERDAIFGRFRRGDTTVLTNCFLASYGFDLPDLSCVVLARPTRSLVLYLQMVGRGLRPADGKEDCIVLDHAGAVTLHGMADEDFPWDLDGATTMEQRQKDRAKKAKTEAKSHRCKQCAFVFRHAIACPKCGWQVPRPRENVETLDGELERLNGKSKHNKRDVYAQLLTYAGQKGYKPGWAYFAFKDLFHQDPVREWRGDPAQEPTEPTKALIKYLFIRRAKAKAKANANPTGNRVAA